MLCKHKQKWPRSVIRLAALMCEKALLILNKELIFFFKFILKFPPFIHNFVYKLLFLI